MQLGVMWNCTFRLHLKAFKEPSRIVLRSVKWNEGQPLERLFSAKAKKRKKIRTQILTQLTHTKACLSSTKSTSTAWVVFAFSPASCIFSKYKLISKAYTVTKQSRHMIRFLFLTIWWHLKGNCTKQPFCSANVLGTSVSQCIRELSTIKHLTEQPYYFHLSKGVLALPRYWTSNAFS